MKKFATILVLLFVLSVSAFADDGTIHTGGKTCPQGQTCFADDGTIHTGGITESPIIKDIYDFLKSIFG
ncbi:MAG: hypothetical protein WA584_15800 [Pyrinomonadaceae bacterium]